MKNEKICEVITAKTIINNLSFSYNMTQEARKS